MADYDITIDDVYGPMVEQLAEWNDTTEAAVLASLIEGSIDDVYQQTKRQMAQQQAQQEQMVEQVTEDGNETEVAADGGE